MSSLKTSGHTFYQWIAPLPINVALENTMLNGDKEEQNQLHNMFGLFLFLYSGIAKFFCRQVVSAY